MGSQRKKRLVPGLGERDRGCFTKQATLESTAWREAPWVVGRACAWPGGRREPGMFGEPAELWVAQAPREVGRGQTRGALNTPLKNLDFTAGKRDVQNCQGKHPVAAAVWSRHWRWGASGVALAAISLQANRHREMGNRVRF